MSVPLLKAAEQFVVQFVMPPGFEFTVPVPATTTVSVGRLKLAVRVELAVNVKLQGTMVPLQATTFAFPEPLVQPVKFDTASGKAVIVITVPDG
jgi:sporulation-control protein spo0M